MINIDNQIYLANRRVKMLVVSVENLLMKKGEEEANLAALEEQLLSEKLNRREVYARMSKLRYDLQSIGAELGKEEKRLLLAAHQYLRKLNDEMSVERQGHNITMAMS